jgi:hypothetical protein
MVPLKAENLVRHLELLSVDLSALQWVDWSVGKMVCHWAERKDNDSVEQKEAQKVGYLEHKWVG